MALRRGDILFDQHFSYDDDNKITCDKYLLILNKDYSPFQDIVFIPATTNKSDISYNNGCNKNYKIFYFTRDGSFYKAGTILQLDYIAKKDGEWFEDMINRKGIKKIRESLTRDEINAILECLRQIREDISIEIQELIF